MFNYKNNDLIEIILVLLLYIVTNIIYLSSLDINIFNIYDNLGKNIYYLLDIIDNKIDKTSNKNNDDKLVKIGLLTNEIPPVVHGGVATWILNFLDMFKNCEDENIKIIPIFLAYEEKNRVHLVENKYKNIRIINVSTDIKEVFSDIDICVNNLWVALESIKQIKKEFPKIQMLTVCHSLIQMEHITNLGSQYTRNFEDQESTFLHSDKVICISKAEEEFYNSFGYDKLSESCVIYNSYVPKFDNVKLKNDYTNNNIGAIGRHVPRKRMELPIYAIFKMNRQDIKVFNMGIKPNNKYWGKLKKIFGDQLVIINFSFDKNEKKKYYSNIGANCVTGIYEPFGYTTCEILDRRIPLIMQDIDGPKEIIGDKRDYVYLYDVDRKNWKNDVDNIIGAIKKFLKTSPEQRKENAEKARKALDDFRPEVIKKEWIKLFEKSLKKSGSNKKLNL